ncbi:MAG: hypothetical protein IIT68_01615 [Treponema sp.]|nr:hypothetical protein [Treponema sp.]
MKKALVVFAVLLPLLLTSCLTAQERRLLAPPRQISVRIVSGNAIISGERTSNPNTYRDAKDRRYERFSTDETINGKYCAEGTTFYYSIPYGDVLLLSVKSFSAVAKENPLVIEVNDAGNVTTYEISGFEATKYLRFTNDYYID